MRFPRRFLERYVLGGMAAAIVCSGALAGFLYACNELGVFFDKNVRTKEAVLWGPAYGQMNAAYKLIRTEYIQPDLLFLGSSRMTQVREVMAPRDVSSFNAALSVASIRGALSFLKQISKGHAPDTVVLGLDSWWFAPEPAHETNGLEKSFDYRVLISNALGGALRSRPWRMILSGRINREQDPLSGSRPVGLMASTTGNGFRFDGSYQYGDVLTGQFAYGDVARLGYKHGFAYSINQLRAGEGRLAYAGSPAIAQINLLREIVHFCRQRKIDLVLIFPPMAHKLFSAIQDIPAQREYFAAISREVTALAQEEGVDFFDFHDLGNLGIDDQHTLDALHVDEIAMLAVVRRLISESRVFRRLYGDSDLLRLSRMAQSSESWAGLHTLVP